MNSIFHEDILEYLSRRERILAQVSSWFDQCVLLSFDQHLAKRNLNKRCITEDDVISWIKPLHSKHSRSTVARWVSALRVFLQYLEYVGIQVYIPPYPKVPEDYIPYLFSDAEIEKIFVAADAVQIQQKLKCPLLRMEFPMLLRMLYSCGFRLGELLTVRISDVSFERGTVLLRNTKNKKQRIVPMTDTLTEMLNRYCLAMNLMSSPDNFIFPGQTAKHHLSPSTAEKWFQKLLISTGIYVPPDKHSRCQCLHCVRHLFAVKSFAQAEQAGRPVNDSIPFLSVYLGHTNMMKTEKYLKFSSDMFPEHTVLFETYSDGIFPEVLYEE